MKESKKKGFTLTELLAVIVVLGVVLSMGGVAVFNIIAQNQENLLKDQLKSLGDTAVTYIMGKGYVMESCGKEESIDPSSLTNQLCFQTVTVKELVDSGFFENKNDLCLETGKITVYKVNTIGNTYELKSYIPANVCSY